MEALNKSENQTAFAKSDGNKFDSAQTHFVGNIGKTAQERV
jgi:hypothetical protein